METIAERATTEKVYKLDWNESTIPPSPSVLNALDDFLKNQPLNWYPDLEARALRTKLSDYVGVPDNHILVTNGSDDALDLVCRTYLNSRDEVVVPMPTYTHFLVFAGARGAQVSHVYGDTPFDRNTAGVLSTIGYQTKLIYLVSPNNPTGVVYPQNEIEAILQAAPNAIVIVDEAYYEFSGKSAVPLIAKYPNLVVTRTFSKSFGIAGLRIGYVVAHPEVISSLKRLHNPKSVNMHGQVAAAAALDDLDYLRTYVRQVTESKKIWVDYFGEKGIRCYSGDANFVLLEVEDPNRFCELLADHGVYIRDRSSIPQLRHFVRMSVGTVEQTREVIERMNAVLVQLPHAVRLH